MIFLCAAARDSRGSNKVPDINGFGEFGVTDEIEPAPRGLEECGIARRVDILAIIGCRRPFENNREVGFNAVTIEVNRFGRVEATDPVKRLFMQKALGLEAGRRHRVRWSRAELQA